ncbi:MAG: hypothetical protein K2X98_01950 [Alphaproteobacteria bacterium]|nr:hypothetical protein [Alphaproteobacteria bacterium]
MGRIIVGLVCGVLLWGSDIWAMEKDPSTELSHLLTCANNKQMLVREEASKYQIMLPAEVACYIGCFLYYLDHDSFAKEWAEKEVSQWHAHQNKKNGEWEELNQNGVRFLISSEEDKPPLVCHLDIILDDIEVNEYSLHTLFSRYVAKWIIMFDPSQVIGRMMSRLPNALEDSQSMAMSNADISMELSPHLLHDINVSVASIEAIEERDESEFDSLDSDVDEWFVENSKAKEPILYVIIKHHMMGLFNVALFKLKEVQNILASANNVSSKIDQETINNAKDYKLHFLQAMQPYNTPNNLYFLRFKNILDESMRENF